MAEILVKALLGYLAGSVVGSLLLGRLRGVDIRRLGSGNAGGTNALRTQGRAFALGVLVIDVLKAVLPITLLTGADLPAVPVDPEVSRDVVAAVIGAAAVIGHCLPVFYGFRGGKGMATLVGAYAALSPALLVPLAAAWLLVLLTTGYVGLATMLGAAAAPLWLVTRGAAGTPLFVFAVAMAALIVFTHRSNIARMRAGTESRMLRAGRRGK